MRVRGLAAVCAVLCSGLCAALTLSACNKKLTADAAGTVRLLLTADVKLKSVVVIAYSKDGSIKKLNSVDVSKDDLQKPGVEEDINSGDSFKSGEVMFVGVGYDATDVQLATGSAITTFAAGQIVVVNLAMKSGVIDADQDGDPAETDCNDNNSMQNHFLTELCTDSIDNNCDGSINEGCACSGGPRACYSFDPSTRGLGKCRDGAQVCTNGVWATCAGAIGPDPETCDNIDNNCDGSVDEGCSCTSGDQRYCNNNQVTTPSQDASALHLQGLCVAGTQVCKSSVWGTCILPVLPTPEICDGLDNDCDGVPDNGFDLDVDGYTTCGTLHAACDDTALASATPSALVAGPPSAQFIDCDDANPARHPCQANQCEGNADIACSNSIRQCGGDEGSCQSLGYFGGIATPANSLPICYALAGEYFSSCEADAYTCSPVDESDTAFQACRAGNGASSATISYASKHKACDQVDLTKCAIGTQGSANAPGDLAPATPVSNGTDPYNDCPPVSCQGDLVYVGKGASNTDNGWDYTGSVFQCKVHTDTVDPKCQGGACDDAFLLCAVAPTEAPSPIPGLGSTDLPACVQPKGLGNSVGVTAGDQIKASSCFATSLTVHQDPLFENVAGGAEDPAQRCSKAGLTCTDFTGGWVPGVSGTSICLVYGNEPASAGCGSGAGGGACANIASDFADACAPASSQNKTRVCANECAKNGTNSPLVGTATDVCMASSAKPSDYCFNANGGTPGGSCGSLPSPTAQTCLDDNNSGGATNASCQDCIHDYACGTGCAVCSAGTPHCKETSAGHATCGTTVTDKAGDCACHA